MPLDAEKEGLVDKGYDFGGLAPEIVRQITFRACSLVGRAGFTTADRDDIEQDLALHVRSRMAAHDSSRSALPTYVARILKTKAASMIAARKSRYIDFRMHEYSLNERFGSKDQHEERGDRISGIGRSVSDCRRTDFDLADLRMDIARVLEILSGEQLEIAGRIMIGETLEEVAKGLEMSRQMVYRRVRKIRTIFEEAGLRSYIT